MSMRGDGPSHPERKARDHLEKGAASVLESDSDRRLLGLRLRLQPERVSLALGEYDIPGLCVLVVGDSNLQYCQPGALGGLPRSNSGSVLVPIVAGCDLLTGGGRVRRCHSLELGMACSRFRQVHY